MRPLPAHLLAGGLCTGLAAANAWRVPPVLAVTSVAVLAGAVAFVPAEQRIVLVAAVAAVAGWGWGSARLQSLDASALQGQVGRAETALVVITATPRRSRFAIRAEGRARRFGQLQLDERVELELPLGRSPPQGAIIEALAVAKAPRGPEGGFNERRLLRRRGIHVVLRVDRWHAVGRRGGVGGLADRLRHRLAGSIAPGLSGGRRALLEGIVLGDAEALSTRTRDDFRAAGLYHLLAVSGQNVVLVAAGALVLAWLLGLPRWFGELGALSGIAGYVLAVGPQPSVIRAGIAGGVASLAWLTGRLRDAWYVLLLGAVTLLAWNPYVLFDAGFQLSFVAVAAIFTLAPRLMRRLEGYPLPRLLAGSIAISAACGAATAPILWLQFGRLPLLGIAANALAEPAMPALLGLAFVTAAVALVSPPTAAVLAWANGWVAAYIALCARAIAAVPGAQIDTGRSTLAVVGALLGGAYAWRRWRTT